MMMRYVVAYAAALVAMLVLDFAWLGVVGGALFKRTLGDVMAPQFSMPAAAVFYLVYAVGIVYFAVSPALDGGWTTALMRGALFGFFAYLTYDMTNLATIRNYTAGLALVDLIWGTIATGVSAAVSFWVADLVARRFG